MKTGGVPTLPVPLEKEIQRAILDYLEIKGHFAHPYKAGAFAGEHKGKKRFIRTAAKGTPDIIGCAKGGDYFAIEVKRKGESATLEQLNFIHEIHKRGGVGFVAYSVDDVISRGL